MTPIAVTRCSESSRRHSRNSANVSRRPLVAATLYQQFVPIEVDAQGAWVSVTATNVLQLTPGTF